MFGFCHPRDDGDRGVFDGGDDEIVDVVQRLSAIVATKIRHNRRMARTGIGRFHFDRYGRDRRTVELLIGIGLTHQIDATDCKRQSNEQGKAGDPFRLEADHFCS